MELLYLIPNDPKGTCLKDFYFSLRSVLDYGHNVDSVVVIGYVPDIDTIKYSMELDNDDDRLVVECYNPKTLLYDKEMAAMFLSYQAGLHPNTYCLMNRMPILEEKTDFNALEKYQTMFRKHGCIGERNVLRDYVRGAKCVPQMEICDFDIRQPILIDSRVVGKNIDRLIDSMIETERGVNLTNWLCNTMERELGSYVHYTFGNMKRRFYENSIENL